MTGSIPAFLRPTIVMRRARARQLASVPQGGAMNRRALVLRSHPQRAPSGNVRFGSLADIKAWIRDVRFTPKSRLVHLRYRCPLSARSGLGQVRIPKG